MEDGQTTQLPTEKRSTKHYK